MQVPPIRYATPSSLHRGTTGALAQWLEQYINALFPESGIESWYVPKRYPDMGSFLAGDDVLPECVHHVACCAANGANEGRYIYIGVIDKETRYRQIAAVKSFGSAEECWAIARACSEALTLVFHFHEQPVFRELWLKLPRAQSWHRSTSLVGEVRLCSLGTERLEVIAADGTPIDKIAFSGPASDVKRKAYAEDWATLLRAQGLTVCQDSIEVAPCPVA